MPALAVPYRAQNSAYDCGEAVARMVLAFHGRQWPRNRFPGWPCPVDGTDPRTLESFFRGNCFRVQSGEMQLADLRHHTRAGRPVACLVQCGGVGHWVCVNGVIGRMIQVLDPASGPRVTSGGGFVSIWSDLARDGTTYQGWGIAVG